MIGTEPTAAIEKKCQLRFFLGLTGVGFYFHVVLSFTSLKFFLTLRLSRLEVEVDITSQ